MTKVDIVLGGGRQLPNILGAYRDDCDLVDVVASGDQPKAVEGLRAGHKVLASSGAANIRTAEVAPTQYVDAFDPSAILKACREVRSKEWRRVLGR